MPSTVSDLFDTLNYAGRLDLLGEPSNQGGVIFCSQFVYLNIYHNSTRITHTIYSFKRILFDTDISVNSAENGAK